MDPPTQHRTLIVANLTASTPFLLQEVSRLAAERPTKFTLLVPNVDPSRASDWSLETAEKLLTRAVGSPVKGSLGGQDPLESIREAFGAGHGTNRCVVNERELMERRRPRFEAGAGEADVWAVGGSLSWQAESFRGKTSAEGLRCSPPDLSSARRTPGLSHRL